jgi:hypothetical protein
MQLTKQEISSKQQGKSEGKAKQGEKDFYPMYN